MWEASFPYLFQLGSFKEVQKSLLGDPLSVSFMLKLLTVRWLLFVIAGGSLTGAFL
jgi:hypothetical protein